MVRRTDKREHNLATKGSWGKGTAFFWIVQGIERFFLAPRQSMDQTTPRGCLTIALDSLSYLTRGWTGGPPAGTFPNIYMFARASVFYRNRWPGGPAVHFDLAPDIGRSFPKQYDF